MHQCRTAVSRGLFGETFFFDSAAALSIVQQETLNKRRLLSLHYWNAGTATEVQILTNQLQDLALLHQSKEQTGLAIQYLHRLKTICNCNNVIKRFCDTGGAYVLAAFVDHSEREVRSLSLDLSASITCKKRYFQNAFVLCHFLRILLHLVEHSTCEMTREKSLTLMFCLCIKNESVSQLFCQSGGASVLLRITRYPLLSTASCVMLGMVLETVPQYKQRAYEDGAVEFLADIACRARDDLLQTKAVEAMVVIMNQCSETSNTGRIRETALRELHSLFQQFEEQAAARSLAAALLDVVHCAEAKEEEGE
ncbi:hypothetical protein M514_04046 [Trichuris suis]|uniref:Uncharacterized protein n=1 Tax=Trichuris suis TaxID=68888 RepID=A0A085MD32_9BILA|nr:hypothetical protein M513_04046 [Trichuris suis]KFD72520.1 hypothetical protein M514_04046 [Trichuris suis]